MLGTRFSGRTGTEVRKNRNRGGQKAKDTVKVRWDQTREGNREKHEIEKRAFYNLASLAGEKGKTDGVVKGREIKTSQKKAIQKSSRRRARGVKGKGQTK